MCWCNPNKGTRMTDEEIHNIYLHMSGKAEGLVEANGTADFPVLFARAILEYDRLTKDAQNMASKSTYKEQLETKDEEVEEAHHIIYKSCINQPHWKRSAMRYLKRNAPMLHHQAVHEFNEHPDGRGKE